MKLRIFRADGTTAEIEVDPATDNVESIAVLAEIEFGIPVANQRIAWRGIPLALSTPLSRVGVNNNDLIQVTEGPALAPQRPLAAPQQQPAASAAGGVAPDPEILRLFGGGGGGQQQPQTQQQQAGADEALLRLFQQSAQARPGMGQPIDSDDPDIQRRMYEEIQRRNIDENLKNALEMTPEAFARVTMLYINAEVNGVKQCAFIDSGAQMTVMSMQCAERCNIARLIDKRHQGMAHGVGQTKIIGKIHMALVKIAGLVLPMSITILDASNMQFLIGLDQLRHHQMCIDLKKNELKIDDEHASPFLNEHELPPELRDGIPGHDEDGAAPSGGGMGDRAPSEAARAAASAAAQDVREQAAASVQARQQQQQQQRSTQEDAAAAGQQQQQQALTAEQREKVQNLCALFQCPPAAAAQALAAADWNPDLAANLLISMMQ